MPRGDYSTRDVMDAKISLLDNKLKKILRKGEYDPSAKELAKKLSRMKSGRSKQAFDSAKKNSSLASGQLKGLAELLPSKKYNRKSRNVENRRTSEWAANQKALVNRALRTRERFDRGK